MRASSVFAAPILARRPLSTSLQVPPTQPGTTPPFQKMQIRANLAKVVKKYLKRADALKHISKFFCPPYFPGCKTSPKIQCVEDKHKHKPWKLSGEFFAALAREGVFQEPSTGKVFTCGKTHHQPDFLSTFQNQSYLLLSHHYHRSFDQKTLSIFTVWFFLKNSG